MDFALSTIGERRYNPDRSPLCDWTCARKRCVEHEGKNSAGKQSRAAMLWKWQRNDSWLALGIYLLQIVWPFFRNEFKNEEREPVRVEERIPNGPESQEMENDGKKWWRRGAGQIRETTGMRRGEETAGKRRRPGPKTVQTKNRKTCDAD